ncbi:DNA modification methylase [Paenibacillus athensensis]|uniref:site-specific DNA-methyltransferase (cytosine-N(4)-specific) n=2 Tax=Paenibacillus athensensis TaxID=1967502 RepID=A0A4Y8PUG7_9BACL|nr:DNA modification methylase [Paenibacillus athensensis]
MMEEQLELFADIEDKPKRSTTFLDNMKLPIHRWFRYSAGFSAEWIASVIQERNPDGREDFHVFDPFAGSGTVLLASDQAGVCSAGTEAHPFVARMTRAKLHGSQAKAGEFMQSAKALLEEARRLEPAELQESYNELIYKCYPPHTLHQLTALKQAWQKRERDGIYSELLWLALVAILRACSPAGTAQWQYVLPNKQTKAKIPFEAFEQQARMMSADMQAWQQHVGVSKVAFFQEDARACPSVPDVWADLVVTSPPYANNYDYADATRLEMSFFNEIQGWGDLQDVVRSHLVRSCTQHVSKLKKETYEILQSEELRPIYPALLDVCRRLDAEKELHGGKKNYHTMIALYFLDLARVWIELRRICKPGADVVFVIGDSAPYGIYVPVDTWLGELALAAGFTSYRFDKARDRNTKWKNRKHTVPLKEGFLWVKG